MKWRDLLLYQRDLVLDLLRESMEAARKGLGTASPGFVSREVARAIALEAAIAHLESA